MNGNTYGFRIVGPCSGERRLVDAAAAFAAYAACDDRAHVEREAYLSAFRFGPDFADHLRRHGTTRGYAGCCWSPWLWFDIDREGDLERARIGQEIATTSVALTQRDLRRAVTAAYYRAVLTRRLVQTVEDALAESTSFEQRTKLLVQGGEAAQADLTKASAQVAFLQQSLNAAQLEATLASQELASFWTRDVADPLSLADSLDDPPPPPEPDAAQSAPFLKRLEFNLLDAQRRGFQADARRARAALLPQLAFVFQYGIDSTAVRIKDRGYAAFFNLSIPLFDWNKARAEMQAANLRAKQTESIAAISQRKYSMEYQSALARVKHLFDQIALTRRQAQLAEDDLRLSRIRYEGGEGSSLDVVTAQNQLAQARGNHYTIIANYLNARADLEVASGR